MSQLVISSVITFSIRESLISPVDIRFDDLFNLSTLFDKYDNVVIQENIGCNVFHYYYYSKKNMSKNHYYGFCDGTKVVISKNNLFVDYPLLSDLLIVHPVIKIQNEPIFYWVENNYIVKAFGNIDNVSILLEDTISSKLNGKELHYISYNCFIEDTNIISINY